MSDAAETRVPCSRDTREALRSQKRGGESFNTLLRKMIAQYDPDAAGSEPPEPGETTKTRG